MSASPGTTSDHQTDAADLARYGYKQELKRGLGLFMESQQGIRKATGWLPGIRFSSSTHP